MATGPPDVLSFAKTGDVLSFVSLPPEQVLLCGTGPAAVRDKYDGYCIHWAAGCGHLQCLQWLVDVAGADPSVQCKGSGRQPSHYAARNGHLACLDYLLQSCGCDMNALAKHDVTPLQLAVWQNQLAVAEYLCGSPGLSSSSFSLPPSAVRASPLQVNAFACALPHWLATATREVGGEGGVLLLPMAEWLLEQGCDFFATQRSGHTVLHKAAWGGHLVLCRWLHFRLGVMDSVTDHAGNYAADCASMGRHPEISNWLRAWCSLQRGESLRILGLDPALGRPPPPPAQLMAHILDTHVPGPEEREQERAVAVLIRNAYLEKARQFHPDRRGHRSRKHSSICGNNSSMAVEETVGAVEKAVGHMEEQQDEEEAVAFVEVQRAYEHLTVGGGRGQQRNERHDLKNMLGSLAHTQGTHTHTHTGRSQQGTASPTLGGGEGSAQEGEDKVDVASLSLTGTCSSTSSCSSHNISEQEQVQEQEREHEEDTSPLLFFKARLLAALLDYSGSSSGSNSGIGGGGMPASSLRKKWREIWPDHPFPSSDHMHLILDQLDREQQEGTGGTCDERSRSRKGSRNKCKKIKVLSFLQAVASDCCRIEVDPKQPGAEPLLFAIH